MKPIYLIPFLLAAVPSIAKASAEPSTSVMASGHWVKIRVDSDGMYQLTYDRLRELGFSNPEKVKLFGYQPNVLLTHRPEQMPSDLTPLYSVNESRQGKIYFYGKSDTNFAPEFWTVSNTVSNIHDRHPYSVGATYFLSDVEVSLSEPEVIAAPVVAEIHESDVLTTHTALVYHEEDATILGEGGYLIAGKPIGNSRSNDSKTLSVNKVADDGKAKMIYRCMMSPSKSGDSNYLLASYSDGIMSEESTGLSASYLSDSHERFRMALRYQNIILPAEDGRRNHTVDFAVHPNASPILYDCALDYCALLYSRRNDMKDESQMHMYFENWHKPAVFSLSSASSACTVWNVSQPNVVRTVELADRNGTKVGALAAADDRYPNEIVAFDPTSDFPEPVVCGKVNNQNLHALQTPDLVILTSSQLMESAEYAADFHRNTRGLEVVVADQQQVFNEYGSGNTSPEAVRRFLLHLAEKTPGKLRAMLIIGPATQMNALNVNDDQPYVVIPECEDEEYCTAITRSYCSDTFYGRLGDFASDGLWPQRVPQLRLLGGDMAIGVGRLPFFSNSEVLEYYKKAADYVNNPPTFPSIGNVIVSSDYSSQNEESHFCNAEAVVQAFGTDIDNDITVFRPASNLYSSVDNTMTKRLMNEALRLGSGFYAYFGHGAPNGIGGTNSKVDLLMQSSTSDDMQHVGRYPLFYIGSCRLAPIDIWPTYLSRSLIANPNGGGIAVIASAREVYQPMNQALGECVARQLHNAADGDWLGDVWREAQMAAVQEPSLSKRNVVNHLNYNFLGDPAMPVYVATHDVAISAINADGNLKSKAANVVEGTVNVLNGTAVDTRFNGYVLLTVYDTPTVKHNIVKRPTDVSKPYIESVETDMEEIGEYIGEVKNGRFSVNFTGPATSSVGTHRIRAYAYSADGTQRGLGSRKGIAIVDNKNEEVMPDGGAPVIRDFVAGSGSVDSRNPNRTVLSARIETPAGIAASNQLVNPVRLTVDGNACSGATNLLTPAGVNVYDLKYVTSHLKGGRHTATLSVLDAAGRWTDATISFMVENALPATMSAAVDSDSGEINFELTSSLSAQAKKRLVVESLDGEVVMAEPNAVFPCKLTLAPGVYRAYVQLQTPTALTSTPKVELVID